jgi:hypothetical protein
MGNSGLKVSRNCFGAPITKALADAELTFTLPTS